MTFAQMQSEVRRWLNQSSTIFWTDEDIQDAINEGYDEMADATEFYERQATMPLLAGRSYYDLTSILPDTMLTPKHIWNTTTQKWLDETDPMQLDTKTYVQWELTHGEPQMFLMRGHWWIGVFPKKDTDSSGLRLYYTGIPDHMSDDDDEPLFPREFHNGLVDFALSDLHSQQRETKKAIEYWQSYIGYQTRLKAYVDGRQSIARSTHL